MKKIFLVLIVSLFAANVYADSHVKRILSTSHKAKWQMTYYTPDETMTMFCHWMAESTDAINEQLSAMNDFFEPHQFTEVKEEVFNFNS